MTAEPPHPTRRRLAGHCLADVATRFEALRTLVERAAAQIGDVAPRMVTMRGERHTVVQALSRQLAHPVERPRAG